MFEIIGAQAGYWRRDLIAITLALAVLFGVFLGNRPLTVPDEGRYAEIPREMLVTGDYVTPHLNSIKYFEKPPFFYWVQSASIRWVGLNEWGARIPNALFGLLGVLLTYSCARLLYGRRTGLLSAMVLSTSVMYIGMTQMVTLDMTTAVLLAGALFSFILGNQTPPGRTRNLFMWAMYAC
ncbi:MAG: glycosyltransferase family 39 protein, partial [Pseudomonadota bacterium]|nr:glycosyltransferase family 39 protein [Pseudomonadota bacterium]